MRSFATRPEDSALSPSTPALPLGSLPESVTVRMIVIVWPGVPGGPCSPCGPGGPTEHRSDCDVAVADPVLSPMRTYQVASSAAGNQTWNEYSRLPLVLTNRSIHAFWSDWPNARSCPPTRSSLPSGPEPMLSPAWMYASPPGRFAAVYVTVAQ
jgi:hypothetical protein